VRELVYLSDRKLDQFLPTLRSLWPRPTVTVKTQVVEIGIDSSLNDQKNALKHLAKVIAHIERSARWFLDPGISPGQWVHFEAPLNYLVVDMADRDLVFFVDRNNATADYPTGGATRLVLHCSGAHLRTELSPAKVAAPPGDEIGGSGPGLFSADSVQLLLRTLHAQRTPTAEHLPPEEVFQHLPKATSRLLHAIDARIFPETAAWMAGYARVTASFALPADDSREPVRYIIASPLYIEYATPPGIR
jgi:hypothetical protein